MTLRPPWKLWENKGQSLLELALSLLLLFSLILGVFDLSRAIQANNIVSNMSREGANLAARAPTIAHQDIMNSMASTAQWLTNKDAAGNMYLTMYLTTVDASTLLIQSPQESWLNNAEGPQSQIDQNFVNGNLGNLKNVNGGIINIFEVNYSYNFVFTLLFGASHAQPIYSYTIF